MSRLSLSRRRRRFHHLSNRLLTYFVLAWSVLNLVVVVFFTLMPLMTITYVGWSTPDKPSGMLNFRRQLGSPHCGRRRGAAASWHRRRLLFWTL
ncbi:hypothetical protein Trco_006800 [Trichoderma cornu-damae]|uniref:Uncharacterized protein n=1 Tax=Trichoderma cornu-damae TaxID=654480 RepID=A0A9P8TU86_9HYPO|nr:hypothetical protein Trco_006800 [Trichoderma cornu-damae]